MNLILLVVGTLLVFVQLSTADNPFLPVPDDPVPSSPNAPTKPAQPPIPQGQSRVVIRDKTTIQVRGNGQGTRIVFPATEMQINMPTIIENNNQVPNMPIAVFPQGGQQQSNGPVPSFNGGNQQAPNAPVPSFNQNGNPQRVALIPKPMLPSGQSGMPKPDQSNTANSPDTFDSMENQSNGDFKLTSNVQGDPVLIANRPMPKSGLIVLVKTPSGFITKTFKSVDFGGNGASDGDNGNDQDQQFNPDTNVLSNILAENNDNDDDSFESQRRAEMRRREEARRNVHKISQDGSFVKISQSNFNMDQFVDAHNNNQDPNMLWDPAAGIKSTRGNTPQEQLAKDEKQRANARLIFNNPNSVSNPQQAILVISDPHESLPKPILISSDPSGPRPILVASDPHKSLPQPSLVSRGHPRPPIQIIKPEPLRSTQETVVVLKKKNANKQKPVPLPKADVSGDQSTETIAQKSGIGMRVDISTGKDSSEEKPKDR